MQEHNPPEMTKVSIEVGSHRYDIACEASQIEEVKQLAASLNEKVKQTKSQFSSASDLLVLVLTGLMMEDELQQKSDTITSPTANNNDEALEEATRKIQALSNAIS